MSDPSLKPLPSIPSPPLRSSSQQFQGPRPQSSATEFLLSANRRTASDNYIAAQRAETVYKARKRTSAARIHRAEAKEHFKQSSFHFNQGVRSFWIVMTATPWIFRGWREERRQLQEKKGKGNMEEDTTTQLRKEKEQGAENAKSKERKNDETEAVDFAP